MQLTMRMYRSKVTSTRSSIESNGVASPSPWMARGATFKSHSDIVGLQVAPYVLGNKTQVRLSTAPLAHLELVAPQALLQQEQKTRCQDQQHRTSGRLSAITG